MPLDDSTRAFDASQRELRLDKLLAEYVEAIERGQPANREALLAANPDLATELREFFANRDGIEQAMGAVRREPPRGVLPTLRYFGDYELLEEVARGGMGIVYKARQTSLNRIVAVKMILAGQLATADDVRRFRTEAESAANLQHPNIVPVHEVGIQENQHYFSMEFVEGQNLAALVRENPLPARRAAEYVQSIARAVHYAHQQGTLHRDLKPSNVLIDTRDQVRITDFGLATRITNDHTLTQTGQVLGTPSYMAPEQAAGKRALVGPAADIYSLGVILYELLTGRPPFRAESAVATLHQVIHVEPASPRLLNPHIPRDLETICLKCLQKEPHKRYGTAELLADDLRRFLHGHPIAARPISRPARAWRWCRRNPVVASLSGLLLAAMIGVTGTSTLAYLRESFHRQEIEHKNVAIEQSLDREKEARADESQARLAAEDTLTDMYTSNGILAGERGDAAQAAVWFAHAAGRATPGTDREAINRIRVATWDRQAFRPVAAVEHPQQMVYRCKFHPSEAHLIAETFNDETGEPDGCIVWDFEHEARLALPDGVGSATSAVWSPDGKRLALGTPQGDAVICSFPEMQVQQRAALGGKVFALAFSNDGRYLAAAGDGGALVWDSEQSKLAGPLLVHRLPVMTIAFSPDGSRVVTGSRDNQARLFQVTDGSLVFPAMLHFYRVDRLGVFPITPTFISGGQALLTLTYASELAWRNADTGVPIRALRVNECAAVAVSPDGKLLATAGRGGAQLWEVASGSTVGPFMSISPRQRVASIVFTPDGQELITGSADHLVRRWSVPGGLPLGAPLVHPTSVHCVALTADGKLLGTSQRRGLLRVWRIPSSAPGSSRIPLSGSGSLAKLSPDGRHVLPAGVTMVGETLAGTQVFELAGGQAAGPPLGKGGLIRDGQFSPDGNQVALVREILSNPATGQVELWNWREGRALGNSMLLPAAPRSLDYSPDGKRLAVLCSDGQVLVIDPAQWQVVAQAKAYESQLSNRWYRNNGRLRFSRDSQSLLIWAASPQLHVWNVETVSPRYAPLEHADFCNDVDFSPDGRVLASSGRDNSVRFWDLATGRPLAEPLPHPDWVNAIHFSADGKLLVSACRDGMARVWDWQQQRLVCPALEHTDELHDAAFHPDHRWIVTVSVDRTARVWDRTTGLAITPSMPLPGIALNVEVTPDGEYAAVGGFMNPLEIIDLRDLRQRSALATDELRCWGELLAGRAVMEAGVTKLTDEEWLQRWREFHSKHPGYGADTGLVARVAVPPSTRSTVVAPVQTVISGRPTTSPTAQINKILTEAIKKSKGVLIGNGSRASWSFDGTSIVYSAYPPGSGIKKLDLDAKTTTVLHTEGKDASCAPGKPGRVAYVTGNGLEESIWLLDGGMVRRIAVGGFPSWLPDGKTLTWIRRADSKLMALDVETDSAKETVLAALPRAGSWLYPCWSHDAAFVAYASGGKIVVQKLQDGTTRTFPFPNHRIPSGFLAGWHPEGKFLALGSYGNGENYGIWVLNTESGETRLLLGGDVTLPVWSPDGARIAIENRQVGQPYQIWALDAPAWDDLQAPAATDAATVKPPSPSGAEPLWDLVWLKSSTGPNWSFEFDLLPAAFEQSQIRYSETLWNVRSVVGYRGSDGQSRFAAVWTPGAPRTRPAINLTVVESTAEFDKLPAGESPLWISEFHDGRERRRTTIFGSSASAWTVRSSSTAEGFQEHWDRAIGLGRRPALVTIDQQGESRSYRGLWLGDSLEYRYDAALTQDEYRTALTALEPSWRPGSVDAYYESGQRRYAVVWIKDPAARPWLASTAVPTQDLDAEIDRRRRGGYYPVVIHAEGPPE